MNKVGDLKKLLKTVNEQEEMGLDNEIGREYRFHLKRIQRAVLAETGHKLDELMKRSARTALRGTSKRFTGQFKKWADEMIFLKSHCRGTRAA